MCVHMHMYFVYLLFLAADGHGHHSAVIRLLLGYSHWTLLSSLTIHSWVLPVLSCFRPAVLLPTTQWDIEVTVNW